MGWSIGSAGSSGAAQASASIASWQQRQQNVASLFSALGSNNLSAAKQAYSALTNGATPPNASNANSPIAQIGAALSNNDLAGAQQIAKALEAARTQQSVAAGATAPQAVSASGIGSLLNATA